MHRKKLLSNIEWINLVNEPFNIKYVVENELCVGCGVCEAACPNEAIEVTFDFIKGMYIPRVKAEKCNECQKCLDVCYGYAVDRALNFIIFGGMSTSLIGNFRGCYVGYANDEALRYSSTSGGVVSAVLTYALKHGLIDGAIVTKMEAGNPPIPKAFVASTVDEIVSALGSKYCPVSFAECLNAIEAGKRYAVVGLPCHIYGIRKLAEFNFKIKNSITLYLGLLCGGMPSYLGTLYLLKRYKKDNQFITRFEYRGGKWPGSLIIQSKQMSSNQQSLICFPYPEYWHGTYQFFFPYRCTLCNDGFNEFSDISFGDVWLPRNNKKSENSMSMIITRTRIGSDVIQKAFQNKVIQIYPINIQDVVNSQQGLVHFKFSSLRGRVNLNKILRRKLPIFNLKSPPARFYDYILAISYYFGRAMASRKSLWRVFDIYVFLNSFSNAILNHLKAIKNKVIKFKW